MAVKCSIAGCGQPALPGYTGQVSARKGNAFLTAFLCEEHFALAEEVRRLLELGVRRPGLCSTCGQVVVAAHMHDGLCSDCWQDSQAEPCPRCGQATRPNRRSTALNTWPWICTDCAGQFPFAPDPCPGDPQKGAEVILANGWTVDTNRDICGSYGQAWLTLRHDRNHLCTIDAEGTVEWGCQYERRIDSEFCAWWNERRGDLADAAAWLLTLVRQSFSPFEEEWATAKAALAAAGIGGRSYDWD